MTTGILNFDSKKVILSIDQVASAWFGYSPEQLVGQTVDHLFPFPLTRCPTTFLLEGKTKAGVLFPLCLDVREMHGFDASGGESMVYFATLKSGDDIGRVTVTRHGKIVGVNRKIETIFKRTQDELLGKAISLLTPGIDRVDLVEYGDFGNTVNIIGKDNSGRLFPLCLLLESEETKLNDESDTTVFGVTLEELARDIVVLLHLDLKGNILSTSANFVHCLFGYWDSELIGKHIHSLISEEEFPLKLLTAAGNIKSPPNKKPRRSVKSQTVHVSHRRGKFCLEMNITPSAPTGTKEIFIVKLKLVVSDEGVGFFLSSQDNLRQSMIVGNYILGDFINRGTHSNVYKATNQHTGELVVIKMVSPAGLDADFMARQQNEYDLCKKLIHPNIVKYIECFTANDAFCTVMEYCGDGDLQVYVNEKVKIPEDESRSKFRDMCEALACLHNQHIVHGDIKLQNFLLSKGSVKISDFNVSKQVEVDSGSQIIERSTFCGTPAYVAPELLLQSTYGAKEADIWSLGVCLYIYPFESIKHTIDGKYTFPQHVSEPTQAVIRFLLQKDPVKRPNINQILAHEWLNTNATSSSSTPITTTSSSATPSTSSLLTSSSTTNSLSSSTSTSTTSLALPTSKLSTFIVSEEKSTQYNEEEPIANIEEAHKATKREIEEEFMLKVAERANIRQQQQQQQSRQEKQQPQEQQLPTSNSNGEEKRNRKRKMMDDDEPEQLVLPSNHKPSQ